MPKNITISSFKPPKGLLITAALILATEWFLYANRAELAHDYWNKFLINEHALIDMRSDYEYIIIGNSLQKTGIEPVEVNDGLLNMGLPGGKPLEQYVLFKRYLEKHAPPKTLFLYLDPENMRDSLLVILRYFINFPEFLEIFGDLTWRERGCFVMRYWVSLDERKVGLIRRDVYAGSNSDFVKVLLTNRGFMPAPRSDRRLEDDHFAKTSERYQKDISFSTRDLKYLDKIMALAAEKNVKVVFLGFLVPKELDAILLRTGFSRSYLSFWGSLREKYRGAGFVADPILYLDNGYFGDRSHLNKDGAGVYTGYFLKIFEDFR